MWYTYDNNGRVLTDTCGGTYNPLAPNQYITTYTYAMGGGVKSLSTMYGNTSIQSYNYTYNCDGSIAEKSGTIDYFTIDYEYTYDNAGRLVKEEDGTNTTQYTYDAYSNRDSMSVTGDETYSLSYTYDLNNRLTQTVRTGNSPETVSYTYDNNGNQLSKTSTLGSSETFTYDGFNRLKSYTDGITMI